MAAMTRSSGRSGRWAGSGRWPGRTIISANYAVEKIKYAIDRYVNETNRLYGVLNKRLADREFIAGEYSIADMASYPWIVPYKNQGQNIDDFPHLKRWLETIRARPATERAYALAKEVNPNFGQPAIRTEEERKLLFGRPRRWCGRSLRSRHCEERSDEAIHLCACRGMDCFAWLAMTCDLSIRLSCKCAEGAELHG